MNNYWIVLSAPIWVAVFLNPIVALAQDGKRDYLVSCSSCHGVDGHGNGPATYTIPGFVPSDLTALSKGNGGNFPEDEVRQVIDGRKRLPGHSDWDTDMPLWGMQFQEQGREFTPGSEAKVKRRIDALVAYIRSIQRQ